MGEPTITEPGVYDLPADAYHADPVKGGSLSSTGARKLLPPSCPALFRWWVDHREEVKPEWEVGKAAHRLVLGCGPDIVEIPGAWTTNAAKAAVAEARLDGLVPLHTDDYETVHAMAEALREHPFAAALFENGTSEQTLAWRDPAAGVWCRAMVDWLPRVYEGRIIVPDYKTARSAAPAELGRTIHNLGYHVQGAWYLDGVTELGLAEEARFVLVVQEKTPPYLVTVAELDQPALRAGRRLAAEAREVYAECVELGEWPGYSDDVELVGLPPWVERQFEGAWT